MHHAMVRRPHYILKLKVITRSAENPGRELKEKGKDVNQAH
jgi:hypothetical protein